MCFINLRRSRRKKIVAYKIFRRWGDGTLAPLYYHVMQHYYCDRRITYTASRGRIFGDYPAMFHAFRRLQDAKEHVEQYFLYSDCVIRKVVLSGDLYLGDEDGCGGSRMRILNKEYKHVESSEFNRTGFIVWKF
jgi:hypothetical protein